MNTLKHLEKYYAGQGCKCEARSSNECGCNVDWTPKEVYELREDLEFRRQLYKVQAAQLDKIRSERDEAQDAIAGWDNKWKCAVEMAARAENERDEAREDAQKSKSYKKVLKVTNENLKRERDEARNKMADALQEVDLRTLDFERMKQERDEAREALMKIEDLFIDGTDIYADREKMGTIARNALEETK